MQVKMPKRLWYSKHRAEILAEGMNFEILIIPQVAEAKG